MKKPLPTDLEILNAIYERYYDAFVQAVPDRASKIYVPIDIAAIAKELGVDGDIVFGRLYYHLDHLHRYRQDDDAVVYLFTLEAGGDRHCVNFPYMAAVLAALRAEDRKFRIATATAIISLAVSALALAVSLFR